MVTHRHRKQTLMIATSASVKKTRPGLGLCGGARNEKVFTLWANYPTFTHNGQSAMHYTSAFSAAPNTHNPYMSLAPIQHETQCI